MPQRASKGHAPSVVATASAVHRVVAAGAGAVGCRLEPDIDQLSGVICDFKERFGAIEYPTKIGVTRFLFEELPEKIGANDRVQNALRNSDNQTPRIEHDRAVDGELLGSLADHTDLYPLYNTDRT